MARSVILTRAARKELDAVPAAAYQAIHRRLKALADDPMPPGCIKLEDYLYRIRIGEYRAIYTVHDAATVLILRVARRSERTYRRLP